MQAVAELLVQHFVRIYIAPSIVYYRPQWSRLVCVECVPREAPNTWFFITAHYRYINISLRSLDSQQRGHFWENTGLLTTVSVLYERHWVNVGSDSYRMAQIWVFSKISYFSTFKLKTKQADKLLLYIYISPRCCTVNDTLVPFLFNSGTSANLGFSRKKVKQGIQFLVQSGSVWHDIW